MKNLGILFLAAYVLNLAPGTNSDVLNADLRKVYLYSTNFIIISPQSETLIWTKYYQ